MATLSARFTRALRALEDERDLQPIVQLFAEDAEVYNPLLPHPLRGIDGVRRFWRTYLDTFQEIRSEFLSFVDGRDASAVEWISVARLADGKVLEYSGSTLLISQDDRITIMRAYFDPRPLLEIFHREPTPIRRESNSSQRKTA